MQPDFVWVKGRSGATDHALYDSVRGTTKDLVSNATSAETTQATGLTAFGSTGFTVGALAKMNTSAATYVGWQWKGGGTPVSNTSGSITSSVSANTTAGFSVVTYTGTGANATVGHGLGVAPSMIICKNRGSVTAWTVGFTYSGFTWTTDYFQLNDTGAKRTDGAGTVFSAVPTSTTFAIGSNFSSSNFVAYCFAPVAGYSAFGSYTGNGSSDGPFIYTGFRPRFILVKNASRAIPWEIFDSSRNTSNIANSYLLPNASNAEASDNIEGLDFLSNGVKIRGVSTSYNNHTSGDTYIYMAFAENPFKYSLAR